MAQDRDGRAGSSCCWGRHGSSLLRIWTIYSTLGKSIPSAPSGWVSTYTLMQSSCTPLQSSHAHSVASFAFSWVPGCLCSRGERWDVCISLDLCVHNRNLRTCDAHPLLPCDPASHTTELGTTAQRETPQRGRVLGSGTRCGCVHL